MKTKHFIIIAAAAFSLILSSSIASTQEIIDLYSNINTAPTQSVQPSYETTSKLKQQTPPSLSRSAISPVDASKSRVKRTFIDKKAQERELLYTVLGLSEEQKVKAKEIDAKTLAGLGKYLRKVQIEGRKLKDLKARHASKLKIYSQRHKLNVAKKDVDRFLNVSKKRFESILNKEQKAKFRLIDEEKRKETNPAEQRETKTPLFFKHSPKKPNKIELTQEGKLPNNLNK